MRDPTDIYDELKSACNAELMREAAGVEIIVLNREELLKLYPRK